MNEETRNKMMQDYSRLRFKGAGACVKYWYKYNDVDVNLYFDAYDKDCLSLTIVMLTDGLFYATPLNIMNTSLKKEYLPKLPPVFRSKIVVDNKLDIFYEDMQKKIPTAKIYRTNYLDDVIFSKTYKYQKGVVELPFLADKRNTRMTDTMLEQLHEQFHISRKILYQIQRKGYTLVRTDDVAKRSTLKYILNKIGIELD